MIECRKIIFFIGMVVLAALRCPAQSDVQAHEDYLNMRIKKHRFEEDKWKKAVAGLDYSEKIPKPQEPRKNRNPVFNEKWLKAGIMLIGAIGLALLLFYLLKAIGGPANKRIQKNKGIAVDLNRLEENLLETDFEAFIRQAIEQGDYTLALRLYFLWTLQRLTYQKAIVWKKDKTNRDYLTELRTTPLFEPFRTLTRAYEQVWYGRRSLTETEYRQLSNGFETFIRPDASGVNTPIKP